MQVRCQAAALEKQLKRGSQRNTQVSPCEHHAPPLNPSVSMSACLHFSVCLRTEQQQLHTVPLAEPAGGAERGGEEVPISC